MGWKPSDVRSATLLDFNDAFDGWLLANGGSPDEGDDDTPGPDDLDALMERYPDG